MTPETRAELIAHPFPVVTYYPSKSWAGISVGERAWEHDTQQQCEMERILTRYVAEADDQDWSMTCLLDTEDL